MRSEQKYARARLRSTLSRLGIALLPKHLDVLSGCVLEIILQDRHTSAAMALAIQDRMETNGDAGLLELVAHGIRTREEKGEPGDMECMAFEVYDPPGGLDLG